MPFPESQLVQYHKLLLSLVDDRQLKVTLPAWWNYCYEKMSYLMNSERCNQRCAAGQWRSDPDSLKEFVPMDCTLLDGPLSEEQRSLLLAQPFLDESFSHWHAICHCQIFWEWLAQKAMEFGMDDYTISKVPCRMDLLIIRMKQFYSKEHRELETFDEKELTNLPIISSLNEFAAKFGRHWYFIAHDGIVYASDKHLYFEWSGTNESLWDLADSTHSGRLARCVSQASEQTYYRIDNVDIAKELKLHSMEWLLQPPPTPLLVSDLLGFPSQRREEEPLQWDRQIAPFSEHSVMHNVYEDKIHLLENIASMFPEEVLDTMDPMELIKLMELMAGILMPQEGEQKETSFSIDDEGKIDLHFPWDPVEED